MCKFIRYSYIINQNLCYQIVILKTMLKDMNSPYAAQKSHFIICLTTFNKKVINNYVN